MKKIIPTILVLILLTGCSGLYNLNGFILPNDSEFLALIEELDTPEKICQYMTDNFELEEHPYNALTPYQLYLTGKGDCNDLALFAQYCANAHNYETWQILMTLPIYINGFPIRHMIIAYKEKNYLTYSDLMFYNPFGKHYTCFNDIMQEYEVWLSYTVYDYDMNIVETVYNN